VSPSLQGPVRRLKQARCAPPAVLEHFEQLYADGPAPLRGARRRSGPLRIAAIVPSFKKGSGGHQTLSSLLKRLAARGHSVSIWIDDSEGWHTGKPAASVVAEFIAAFGCAELPVHLGFEDWEGGETVLATGWQTVPRALLLEGVCRRAYLVQDHEPQFYPTSLQSLLAEATYSFGLPCIAASSWLADLLATRYGAKAIGFELPVDHDVYFPASETSAGRRSKPTVLFYARAATQRRAVPLGLAALERLSALMPEAEIVLFGAERPPRVRFPARSLGVLAPTELADRYRRSDLGLCFSLTNPSLVTLEMMACGLPCIELASEPMRATFGGRGAPLLCRPSAGEIATRIQSLLVDSAAYAELRNRCLEVARSHHWEPVVSLVERLLTEI